LAAGDRPGTHGRQEDFRQEELKRPLRSFSRKRESSATISSVIEFRPQVPTCAGTSGI
jgi:hypothetical protein